MPKAMKQQVSLKHCFLDSSWLTNCPSRSGWSLALQNHFDHITITYVHKVIVVYIYSGVSAVPTKRSSHYIKGVLIGAMSTMGLALVVLLALLWVWLLSKKERTVKRYTEVKKQVDKEASELDAFSNLSNSSFFCSFLIIANKPLTYEQAQNLLLSMVTCHTPHVRS